MENTNSIRKLLSILGLFNSMPGMSHRYFDSLHRQPDTVGKVNSKRRKTKPKRVPKAKKKHLRQIGKASREMNRCA